VQVVILVHLVMPDDSINQEFRAPPRPIENKALSLRKNRAHK
jgi:hypothetical protein